MRRRPSVALKRPYDPPAADDGTRILVDRLWPRGVRKEDARVDLWPKEVAPSPALRTWFGHDPARFAAFRERYLAELADRPDVVGQLEELVRRGPVTLVYAARDPVHNHAVVLRDLLVEVAASTRRPRAALRTGSPPRAPGTAE